MKSDKPTVRLLGFDGNAFAIMGRCTTAMKKAGWTPEQRAKVLDEMQSGDYDHLLQTVLQYFEVEG